MEELRRKVAKMPFWRQYLELPQYKNVAGEEVLPRLDIRVSAAKSRLMHTKGIAERVENGIYVALGLEGGSAKANRDTLAEKGNDPPVIKLLVRLRNDHVQISVDTSEEPLYRRGYRQPGCGGKSPLREDLAFALLHGSGWRKFGDNSTPQSTACPSFSHLLDPCCGSGTIALEAASIASGLPPGRLRPSPLAGSALDDGGRLWTQLISTAESRSVDIGRDAVMGSDRDRGVVAACRMNAAAAGVEDLVRFEECAVRSSPWLLSSGREAGVRRPAGDLLVCTNPPFGVRSSRKKDLFPLYRTLVDAAEERGAALTVLAHDVALVRAATRNEAGVLFSSQHGGLSVAAMQCKRE